MKDADLALDHEITGAFHVVTARSGMHYFCAENEAQLTGWVTALRSAMHPVPLVGEMVRIGAGCTFVLPIRVESAEVTLAWVFTTEAHSIQFGVTFCSERKTAEASIEKLQRCESHKQAIRGSHVSTGPGVYIMKWDNSQSALTPKHITYAVIKSVLETPNQSPTTN